MSTLYAFGYQGAQLEQVVVALVEAGVSVLVDVRDSRCRGGRNSAARPSLRR